MTLDFYKLVAAAITASFSLSAQATITTANGFDTSWADHSYTGAEGGTGVISGNATNFAHEWRFTLPFASTGSVSIVANPLRSRGFLVTGIAGGTVGLYMDTGIAGFDAGDLLQGALLNYTSTGTSETQSYTSLAAGSYYYLVRGIVSGTSNGNYGLNSEMSVVPNNSVPLPSTLLLLAIPMLATLVSKRKKAGSAS